ncbi:acetyl-CoA C-acetyltransferase [Psychrobacter faecalis]|uniref:acetyl-CoA C-acetyltransferase n=1 Tax=Psychrobacter faecalis TaxID=180588 RepID=UPI003FD0F426
MANSKTAEPKKADDKKSDAKTADTKTDSSNKDNSKKDESKKDDSKKESTAEKSSKDSKTTNATRDDSTAKDGNKKADTASTKTTATTAKESSKTGLSSGQHRVAILGGNRIPFARSNGAYSDDSNTDMLTAVLDGLVERFNLQDEKVGEVVAGAVMKLSRDINLTREATLSTALNPHTPTYDISQACGTGLQATFASANKIALGIIDSAITGGVDTTSDAPIAVGDGLRKVLIKLGAAKDNKQRLKALMGLNPKDLIDSPQNGEPRTGLSMGDHQAITTLEWNISREDQDELAFNSHKNLARAYDEGFFDDLITPYKGLTRDNNLRPDTTLDKLAKLKPVFGKKNANPTMTAANSTPLTDGASCVLLANDEWAKERGLKPLAYIVHQETAAVDFIGKSGDKEGLLMAPAYAVPRMLERAGLTLQDFDFYEIHEAFASQVLSTLAAWEDEKFCQERLGLDAPLGSIDRSKLNVNGSSLAAGHPFAATGGRILATAAKLLDQKGSGRALISICAAGGQGVTCILEK